MAEQKKVLSRAGYNKLVEELKNIREIQMPQVLERLKDAIDQWDISESSQYEEARESRDQLESRMKEIESLLDWVEIVEKVESTWVVKYGSHVKLLDMEREEEVELHVVWTWEVDMSLEKISLDSPLWIALNWKSVWDKISVKAPKWRLQYKILEIN